MQPLKEKLKGGFFFLFSRKDSERAIQISKRLKWPTIFYSFIKIAKVPCSFFVISKNRGAGLMLDSHRWFERETFKERRIIWLEYWTCDFLWFLKDNWKANVKTRESCLSMWLPSQESHQTVEGSNAGPLPPPGSELKSAPAGPASEFWMYSGDAAWRASVTGLAFCAQHPAMGAYFWNSAPLPPPPPSFPTRDAAQFDKLFDVSDASFGGSREYFRKLFPVLYTVPTPGKEYWTVVL